MKNASSPLLKASSLLMSRFHRPDKANNFFRVKMSSSKCQQLCRVPWPVRVCKGRKRKRIKLCCRWRVCRHPRRTLSGKHCTRPRIPSSIRQINCQARLSRPAERSTRFWMRLLSSPCAQIWVSLTGRRGRRNSTMWRLMKLQVASSVARIELQASKSYQVGKLSKP